MTCFSSSDGSGTRARLRATGSREEACGSEGAHGRSERLEGKTREPANESCRGRQRGHQRSACRSGGGSRERGRESCSGKSRLLRGGARRRVCGFDAGVL